MESSTHRFGAILGLSALIATILPLSMVPSVEAVYSEFAECADGVDNDNDGDIDYPQDEGCLSLVDDTEGPRGLFISLSDGLENVEPGGHVTYTISLRSERPEPKLVDVRFLMPHQTNILSISDGGDIQGIYVSWRNVTIHPGQARNLYVNVEVNPHANDGLVLVATVNAHGIRDTDTTHVERKDASPLPISPKLSITDGKVFAEPEEVLSYKITARNITKADKTFTLRTQLPPQLVFINASGDYKRFMRDIEWQDETLKAGESRQYSITASIEEDTAEFMAVRLRVSAGAAMASDTTSVLTRPFPTEKYVNITDGLSTAGPRDELTYEISIDNEEYVLATDVDVNLALPPYTEFVSSTEGGYWTGNSVRWENLTISPNGQRSLRVNARVRSDAPVGATLRTIVDVQGTEAVDVTEVGSASSFDSYARQQPPSTFVRKVADRSEVRPGETVSFTVLVSNTTDNRLSNITVEDRMDMQYLTLLTAQGGRSLGDRVVWNIPSLEPGQQWSTRYTVRVAPRTPHGTELRNIVTVAGNGIEAVSLSERIHTSGIGVVLSLPPTGAANDAIFLGLISMLGLASTFLQRKFLFV